MCSVACQLSIAEQHDLFSGVLVTVGILLSQLKVTVISVPYAKCWNLSNIGSLFYLASVACHLTLSSVALPLTLAADSDR